MFPVQRSRRLRRTEGLRRLARETTLLRKDLVLPVFVVPGAGRREAVGAMPGVERLSPDLLAARAAGLDVGALLIFGVPEAGEKDARGSASAAADGLVPRAVRAVKQAAPALPVITDVCLCAYTDHGHCGLVDSAGRVDNDATLDRLAAMALAHAGAGADVVAPSAMMDGQVAALRAALDAKGFQETGILAYAAKFASSFYGPFREAAHSAPAFGDRRAYQLDPANPRAALRDALLDEAEGADWLMVKPAMPCLDILAALRRATRLPLMAYQVSGEYAMLKHAALAGALRERETVLEALTAIKRAGADAVITYYAEEVAQWIGG
jgi:porphobilinogen synthase